MVPDDRGGACGAVDNADGVGFSNVIHTHPLICRQTSNNSLYRFRQQAIQTMRHVQAGVRRHLPESLQSAGFPRYHRDGSEQRPESLRIRDLMWFLLSTNGPLINRFRISNMS